MSKRKLNSLEQEILLQEQITIANEINRLEFEIANNNANAVQNNRLRFWTFFFSGLVIGAVAVYVLIILIIGDLIGLSLEFQKFLLVISAVLLAVLPLFNILVWVCISLHIRNKNSAYIRANKIMLVRLEKYYNLLKYEFDPEKYKIWDDSFVVDIDENGNLIKYVRFYNEDGSITTKPFVDSKQLREFLDNNDKQERLKAENRRLLEKSNKFKEASNKFNVFTGIDNNIVSKAIIEDGNINNTRFVKDSDFFPEQYDKKVSKWYTKEDYNTAQEFKRELSRSMVDQATENGDNVVVNASWLKEQFDSKDSGSHSFFKNYDLTKSMGQFKDVQQFVNIVRNFDLKHDPSVNWEDTIDPKDFNKEKLGLYNQAIKQHEDRALELTLEQLALEAELKRNNKKILRVVLVDNVGVDTYNSVDPYREIKRELSKQQKRANEIAKTRALFLEYGFEDVNYEGLSISELRKLVKTKIKEHEELERLSKKRNVDEVIALENEIARIKGEKFKEIHVPNEKYQNDDGLWEYYDNDGQYYVCSLEGEWSQIESAEARFEASKDKRIAKLQQKFNERQEKRLQEQQAELDRKQKEIDDAEALASEKEYKDKMRRKEAKELKRQNKENKQIEREQQEEFKKRAKQREEEYQKQFETGEVQQTEPYVETHPANETFMFDGSWMYHDGEGNYFKSNENGEWEATSAPKEIVKTIAVGESFISPWEKEKKKQEALNNIENKDEVDNKNEKLSKKEAKLKAKEEKNKLKENADETRDNDIQASSSVGESSTENNSNANEQQTSLSGGVQQWQDETTGVWWYLDEQGNYFFADESGNWVPYNEQQ